MLRIIFLVALTAIFALAGLQIQAAGNQVPNPILEFSPPELDEIVSDSLSPSTIYFCICAAAVAWNKSISDLEYLFSTGELTIKSLDIGGVKYLRVRYSGVDLLLVDSL